MFEHKTIQWLLGLLAIGIGVYIWILLMDENGRSIILHPLPKQQAYVTAEVDSSIVRRDLRKHNKTEKASAATMPVRMSTIRMVMDSDSVGKVDLYRPLQEAVTIDLEEHKEPVYLTWEDFKSWFQFLQVMYDSIQTKIQQ